MFRRPVLTATGLLLLAIVAATGFLVRESDERERAAAQETAADVSAALRAFRSVYTAEVVERLRGRGG